MNRIAILTSLPLLVGCGGSPAGPSAPVIDVQEPLSVLASEAPIYVQFKVAQGEDERKNLYFEWSGPTTCAFEVLYSRNGPEPDLTIAGPFIQNFGKNDHRWPVPPEFVGGKYRVRLCGTLSDIMSLGSDENSSGGGSQVPPVVIPPAPPVVPPVVPPPVEPKPPVVNPPKPPVDPPACKQTGSSCGDHDKGHGNDDDKHDEDNPGKKK